MQLSKPETDEPHVELEDLTGLPRQPDSWLAGGRVEDPDPVRLDACEV